MAGRACSQGLTRSLPRIHRPRCASNFTTEWRLPDGMLGSESAVAAATPKVILDLGGTERPAMRAYALDAVDGPFREIEIPKPSPKRGQVLVKICASGLNPLDTKIRAGKADHAKQPLPAILGMDMAGVVEGVGSGVTAFKAGDEVYGMVGGVGGLQGTLAEYAAADAALLALKPKALSMKQAAALPLVTITAWEGLMEKAQVKAGQTVLIYAGTGGVGYVAAQIALANRARVFATVSDDKKQIVEELGAIPISRQTSVEQYVADHTGGEGFDVVFDTVGGPLLDASFVAVKRYSGHVVSSLGWGTHSLAPLSFRSATYSGVFTLYPLLTGLNQEHHGKILQNAAELVARGELKPLLARQQFNPDQIDAAFDVVSAGSHGKIVIEF